MSTESQSDQMEMMLTQLEKVMTETEFQQVSALPEALLTHIYTAKKGEIDEIQKKKTQAEVRMNAYKDYVQSQVETQDYEGTKNKLQLALGGFNNNENYAVFITKNLGLTEDGHKKRTLIMDEKCANYLLKLMEKDADRWLKKWDEEHKPKPTKATKVSGGKREKFSGEKKYLNTPETAEGKDNKFFFKGDEDATFTKPTFTAKDGTYQNIKYKAVKHNRYMGGSESVGHHNNSDKDKRDGMCSGVVGWDRAQGSKALADTDMSYAQFRIRCGGKVVNDFCEGWGYCSGCANKKNFTNFFTDKYNFTKGKSMKYNGQTYKEFIEKNLEYA